MESIEERMNGLKVKLNPPKKPVEEISKEIAEKLRAKLYSEDRENKLAEDLVNHPEHYKAKNGVEAIELIAAFTEDLRGMEAVCTANALKYLCRWHKKNGLEDLKKARWYVDYLINLIEETDLAENNESLVNSEWSEPVLSVNERR